MEVAVTFRLRITRRLKPAATHSCYCIITSESHEREFEIIGEALNRIKKAEPELLEHVSEYHRIIGFRNVVAHGYDIIDEKLHKE